MHLQNKKLSVMPTGRDFSLLKSLYDNVVMSFPQIAKMHFAGKSKPTIINRLTKLEAAGLIKRFKVPRLELSGAKNVISVIFQITKLGIEVLQKKHLEMTFCQDPIKLHPYSIDHDLILVDVIEAFKNKFPAEEIVHGELYLKSKSLQGLKPDVVLISPMQGNKVAIELELTPKSERRYRDLILKYRLSKDFKQVIYVTSHKQIETKIRSILGPSQISKGFDFFQLADVLGASFKEQNNNPFTFLSKESEVKI